MSQDITFQLGPLVVRVAGDHPVVVWARQTFAPVRCQGEPGLDFVFSPGSLPEQPGVGDDRFRVGPRHVSFRLRRYHVSIRRDTALRADIDTPDRKSLWLRSLADPEEAWKMWLSHGASLDMHLLKEFAYTLAPMAIHCALLERGAALIHASAIELNGRGLLLPAWGGVGKSTVASRTVLHGRARFLADDHAVLDGDGELHLHPLPMHAYAYHARQDALLRDRMLAACSPINRLCWRLALTVRPKRAVRWVSPADIFGPEKLARRAKIEQVIVMFRGAASGFVWEDVSPAQAARPCVGVIMEEINGLCERLALAGAGWDQPILPNPGEAYEQTRQTYEAAFANAACSRLLVPRNADGQSLMDFLRQRSPIIRESADQA